MVQHIDINGDEYPFLFSMRAVYSYSVKMGMEFNQASNKLAEQGYDDLLELFVEASKQGAKKEDSDLKLSKKALEDEINEEPFIFMKLQRALQESKAFKAISGAKDEEFSKKK